MAWADGNVIWEYWGRDVDTVGGIGVEIVHAEASSVCSFVNHTP